jgi:hypothetical protein
MELLWRAEQAYVRLALYGQYGGGQANECACVASYGADLHRPVRTIVMANGGHGGYRVIGARIRAHGREYRASRTNAHVQEHA